VCGMGLSEHVIKHTTTTSLPTFSDEALHVLQTNHAGNVLERVWQNGALPPPGGIKLAWIAAGRLGACSRQDFWSILEHFDEFCSRSARLMDGYRHTQPITSGRALSTGL
jgi:hypothetical protein